MFCCCLQDPFLLLISRGEPTTAIITLLLAFSQSIRRLSYHCYSRERACSMAIKMFKQLRRRRKQGSVGSHSKRDASESGESSTTVSRKNFFGLSKTPSVRSHPSISHSSPEHSANDESLLSRTVSQPRGNLSIGSVGSLTASTKDSAAPKKVQFTEIKYREYERVLDNNPSCSSGAPVGYVLCESM